MAGPMCQWAPCVATAFGLLVGLSMASTSGSSAVQGVVKQASGAWGSIPDRLRIPITRHGAYSVIPPVAEIFESGKQDYHHQIKLLPGHSATVFDAPTAFSRGWGLCLSVMFVLAAALRWLVTRLLPPSDLWATAAAMGIEDRSTASKHSASTDAESSSSFGDEYEYKQLPPTYSNFRWEVLQTDSHGSRARRGKLTTPRGAVQTPAFIFCATKACIKGLTAEMVKEAGSQIILSNTYHLMLQPGSEVIEALGGLQQVTGWGGPMLTDSGGYQIFSMGYGSVSSEIKGQRGAATFAAPTVQQIAEGGATFRSYVDGSRQDLTPERSMVVQRQLGADLILVLDECTPFRVDKAYTAQSMRRSHRWAVRCLHEFVDHDDGSQALYGIIQGGVHQDLRDESTDFANRQPFFGTAIGGSLGADRETMHDVVGYTAARCRPDRPIHLLGIGGIRDIFHGVRSGIDTFDCVHPTRLGRHGGALVQARYWDEEQPEAPITREHIHLEKSRFRLDRRPIDPTCGCYTCRNHSRGYLHHLLRANETLGGTLISLHNIFFMNRLMAAIRSAIESGTLDTEEAAWVHPRLLRRSNEQPEREQEAKRLRVSQRAAAKEQRIAEQMAQRRPPNDLGTSIPADSVSKTAASDPESNPQHAP